MIEIGKVRNEPRVIATGELHDARPVPLHHRHLDLGRQRSVNVTFLREPDGFEVVPAIDGVSLFSVFVRKSRYRSSCVETDGWTYMSKPARTFSH